MIRHVHHFDWTQSIAIIEHLHVSFHPAQVPHPSVNLRTPSCKRSCRPVASWSPVSRHKERTPSKSRGRLKETRPTSMATTSSTTKSGATRTRFRRWRTRRWSHSLDCCLTRTTSYRFNRSKMPTLGCWVIRCEEGPGKTVSVLLLLWMGGKNIF